MREIYVRQSTDVYGLVGQELREKAVQGDVPPAEVVRGRDLNGGTDVMDTKRLFIEIFQHH